MRRQWARLLAIKMRIELAKDKIDEAILTLKTGLAFARQVASGPFLINGLLGIAIAHIMMEQLEELVALPGAPNLYWALTALPRPLIGFRSQVEIERRLFENLIPELTEARLDKSLTPAEWASLLARIHGRIAELSRIATDNKNPDPSLTALSTSDLKRFKSDSLPRRDIYLKTERKLTDARIAEMSDDQVVAVYLAGRLGELWDDLFKASYLPPRDALPQLVLRQAHPRPQGPVRSPCSSR